MYNKTPLLGDTWCSMEGSGHQWKGWANGLQQYCCLAAKLNGGGTVRKLEELELELELERELKLELHQVLPLLSTSALCSLCSLSLTSSPPAPLHILHRLTPATPWPLFAFRSFLFYPATLHSYSTSIPPKSAGRTLNDDKSDSSYPRPLRTFSCVVEQCTPSMRESTSLSLATLRASLLLL